MILDSEKIEYKLRGENFNIVDPLIQPVEFYIDSEKVGSAKDLLKDLDITFMALK